MKNVFIIIITLMFCSCNEQMEKKNDKWQKLADEVRSETLRSWESYKKYAWGHDVLLPLTREYKDWYQESLYISPIDAYSTLKLMGMNEETELIEQYIIDSVSFDKNIYVKVFEVNIRILGGLLAMYEFSGNENILIKAQDFADRIIQAFNSPTGIPYYWVNLKTGEVKGNVVNVAEAGTYLVEMGLLSYYTGKSKYYQAAKKSTMAVFDRRTSIGLIGEIIDVETGEWVRSSNTHISAGVDSYYEYMLKAYYAFGDPDMKRIWEESKKIIHQYIPEEFGGNVWYGQVNMNTGEKTNPRVTLYDAFFPAVLSLSGEIDKAETAQETWDWLWNQYGLEPMVYNYKEAKPTYPVYDLNPEIIESAYYLWSITEKEDYRNMGLQYWNDIKKYCKTEIAYTQVKDVTTMEKENYMATYFFAETMKYLYLLFSEKEVFDFNNHVFTTEAHPFKLDRIKKTEAKLRLGF